jgi:thiol:disulfide interchange protein DsbD
MLSQIGKRNRKLIILTLLGMLFFAFFYVVNYAFAQETALPDSKSDVDPVAVEAYASHSKATVGQEISVAVKITIDNGWHVNSNRPNEDFLIPTELTLADSAKFEIAGIDYPDGKSVKLDFSPDMPLSVYDNDVWITARFRARGDIALGAATIPVQVTTQACDDRSCVAPTTHELPVAVEIVSNVTDSAVKNDSLFKSLGLSIGQTAPPSQAQEPIAQPETQPVKPGFWAMLKNFNADDFVGRYGYILAFIAMYILGLGLTLTPCVYPIIPITIGYFGSQASGKMSRQFAMASVFGLGIAISYAIVGTIAAFSGSLMGAALQNPAVLVGLAALCFVMGLNAFGVFEITLPGWLMGITSGGSRKGIAGAALMGLTMGIAAAPCLAAFIVSLLAFIGQKGDPVLGFSMFFILGLGLATPFVALGTFSGLVSKAPRAGGWMVYAKKIMGALLFAATLYFLNTVLPKPLHTSLVVIALTAAGLYFGFFENTPAKTWRFKVVRYLFAVIFIGGAIWYNTPSHVTAESTGGIAWQKYTDSALAQAKADSRPIVIDFYADWCIPCKELDKFSFSDPRVIETSRDVAMLKADLTKGNTPEVKKMIADYGIKGVPTIVFINADGDEIRNLRINQFEKADIVLARFNDLLKAGATQTTPIAGGMN